MVVDLLLDEFPIGIVDVFGGAIARRMVLVRFGRVCATVLMVVRSVTLVVVTWGRLVGGLVVVHGAHVLVLYGRGVDCHVRGDVGS